MTALGPRRAAIALLSLREDLAAALLAQLGEPELAKLRRAVDELGEVSEEEATQVLSELAREVAQPTAAPGAARPRHLRRLVERAFGETRAEQLLSPTAAAPIDRLRAAPAAELAQLLGDEHPQIAAMVLTQLPPTLAASTLGAMNPELAADIVSRIAELREVSEDVVEGAVTALVQALAPAGEGGEAERAAFDGATFSAALVGALDPVRDAAVLQRLGGRGAAPPRSRVTLAPEDPSAASAAAPRGAS
ncbi:MAG: hypothetical protein R3B48_17905 [Kofleriaceae bacterium]